MDLMPALGNTAPLISTLAFQLPSALRLGFVNVKEGPHAV